MISLIIAAETMVPEIIAANEASIVAIVFTAMPVKIKDTPECGRSVKPRYLVTLGSALVNFPPI